MRWSWKWRALRSDGKCGFSYKNRCWCIRKRSLEKSWKIDYSEVSVSDIVTASAQRGGPRRSSSGPRNCRRPHTTSGETITTDYMYSALETLSNTVAVLFHVARFVFLRIEVHAGGAGRKKSIPQFENQANFTFSEGRKAASTPIFATKCALECWKTLYEIYQIYILCTSPIAIV